MLKHSWNSDIYLYNRIIGKGVEEMDTEKLKKRMAEMNIKSRELSKIVGVTEQYISLILNGFRTPNVLVAKKIADTLECTIEDLL